MADWKQITARIRRARSGKDPLGQLANLDGKTSDAMVAFELAKLFENSGQNSDAAKWYSTAAARFRRAEWKSKAEEAAVRLGGSPREATTEGVLDSEEPSHLTPSSPGSEEKQLPMEQNPEALESAVALSSEIQEASQPEASPAPQTGGRRFSANDVQPGNARLAPGLAGRYRGAEPQRPLRGPRTLLPAFLARNAVPPLACLSSRET